MRRSAATIGTFLIGALAVALAHGWTGAPKPVAQPGFQRLACVSYANRESWLTGAPDHIPADEIRADLMQLAPFADCVRTYHTDRGQDQVVGIAAELGMKVVLGASIGSDRVRNRAEIERAIAVAKANPGTVRMIVIGNEVLLRRDLSMAEMAATVDRVRSEAGVPVTTAEIWSAWLKHPELAQAVDVITLHILPYWDIQASSMDEVLAFTEASVKRVAQSAPGKPIFIGEVGWPSFGRARGGVEPGLVEQAAFLRGLVDMAARNGWSYNAIEGFDQPWKRRWEGAAGGYWGVLDEAGRPKWPFDGPVSANPDWPRQAFLALAVGGALLVAALALARNGRRWPLAGLLAPFAGALLVQQMVFSFQLVARVYEPVLALGALGLSAVLAVLGLAVAAGRPKWNDLGWLALAIRVGAASSALAMLMDPRHRDFHTLVFLLPALVLALAVRWKKLIIGRHPGLDPGSICQVAPWIPGQARDDENWGRAVLGWIIALSVLASTLREGLANTQALGWAVVCLLLAVPMVVQPQKQAEDGGRRVGEGVAEGGSDDSDAHGQEREAAPAQARHH